MHQTIVVDYSISSIEARINQSAYQLIGYLWYQNCHHDI